MDGAGRLEEPPHFLFIQRVALVFVVMPEGLGHVLELLRHLSPEQNKKG